MIVIYRLYNYPLWILVYNRYLGLGREILKGGFLHSLMVIVGGFLGTQYYCLHTPLVCNLIFMRLI